MAHDIFISYSRRDLAAVKPIKEELERLGFSCWMDIEGIESGSEEFTDIIAVAIEESSSTLFFLSDGSQESRWSLNELRVARDEGKHVVLVRFNEDRMKVKFKLEFGGSDIIDWRKPEQKGKLLCNLRNWTTKPRSGANSGEVSLSVKAAEGGSGKGLKGRTPMRKNLSESEIPSTVTSPSSVFVGREAELEKLHELLCSGKIPVVTGPGGTGKSELIFQYAARFRSDYPGGLFQIDAETAKDWDGAYFRMLSQSSQPGVDVRRHLGLPKEKEQPSLRADDIIGALRRRAESAGRILLVLDNVESACDFFDEETLRLDAKLPLGVSAVATARNADEFESGERGVVFSLSKLDPKQALDLLCQDKLPDSDAERTAAEDIVDQLGQLPLYICRVRALLRKRNGRPPFASSYSALSAKLRERLPETVGAAMLREEDKRRTPDALWKLTREALSADPSGAAWIKLAHVASFFSPDGIKKSILRYLWGALVAPDVDTDEAFEQALDILRWHWILSDARDGFRMHRLIIDALRRSARKENPAIGGEITTALSNCGEMGPEDWYEFGLSAESLAGFPESVLRKPLGINEFDDVSLQARLIYLRSELFQSCCTEWFSGSDWSELLQAHPQFASFCPWEKLNGLNWALLLESQPQFADRCPWEKLDGRNWALLLRSQPRFSDHCLWEKLDGENWVLLLESQPQFADRCPWEKLDGRHPYSPTYFEDKYGDFRLWKKFRDGGWRGDSFWTSLLEKQPQFAEYCPWGTLNGTDWLRLLEKQPRFSEQCPWDKLQGKDWALLLRSQPQFASRCPWEILDGIDWMVLLNNQPQFADRCFWGKLAGADWACLLGKQPQFADRCQWEKLDGSSWSELLESQPQFADHCSWEKLTGWNWACLLCRHPQFADHCSWEKLDDTDWPVIPWVMLLESQPQFVEQLSFFAQRGDAKAQFSLGRAYYFGTGVSRNQTEAFSWFLKAADKGVRKSFSFLAQLLFFFTERKIGRLEETLSLAENVARSVRKHGTNHDKIIIFDQLAAVLDALGRAEETKATCEEELPLFSGEADSELHYISILEEGDPLPIEFCTDSEHREAALVRLGRACRRLGDAAGAKDAFRQALALVESHDGKPANYGMSADELRVALKDLEV